MLRACRRVLRSGGRLGFCTIFAPSDLSDRDYRRARRAGPAGIASWRREHTEMLDAAGFVDIEEVDLTHEYLSTTRAWLEARTRHAEELRRAEGATCDLRIQENQAAIAAIGDGLLRRALFVARRP